MESPKPIHRTPPKNLGLLELIRAKREWDWKPSVEELKKGFRGWHQRGYLPHFDAPGITQRYGVRGVPTVMVFKGGEKKAQHVGVTNKDTLVKMLES